MAKLHDRGFVPKCWFTLYRTVGFSLMADLRCAALWAFLNGRNALYGTDLCAALNG